MSPLNELLDVVVITGAGRGIGAAIARHLGNAGVPVVCVSRSNAAQVAEEIRSSGGRAESICVDFADPKQTAEAVQQWLAAAPYKRFGVVLAAGVTGAPGGLLNSDLSDWIRTMQINLFGNWAALQVLLPRLLQAHFGRIVAFSGGGSAYAYPIFSGYAASKAAVVRATENLDEELKGKGDFCTVCLAPGAIETDMLKGVRAAGAEVRRLGSMEEPVHFVERFLGARHCAFSGRFVHARDAWAEWLDQPGKSLPANQWLLRRIEP
ncbi:MAG TPA: SDR family NAD(P)-dependent oxidoreductase [Bryobacteraceae bacterium]|nr:SDR family NAD(P)-dependent oxidoreductase [Bryobacteraceae bacterium]